MTGCWWGRRVGVLLASCSCFDGRGGLPRGDKLILTALRWALALSRLSKSISHPRCFAVSRPKISSLFPNSNLIFVLNSNLARPPARRVFRRPAARGTRSPSLRAKDEARSEESTRPCRVIATLSKCEGVAISRILFVKPRQIRIWRTSPTTPAPPRHHWHILSFKFPPKPPLISRFFGKIQRALAKFGEILRARGSDEEIFWHFDGGVGGVRGTFGGMRRGR